mgnify:CR=1 FL=1
MKSHTYIKVSIMSLIGLILVSCRQIFLYGYMCLPKMPKVKKSEYIKLSKTITRKLYDLGCFGEGSVYIHVLQSGIPKEEIDKVEKVLEALIKQQICGKKKKEHGWKYFLNMKRLDKIREIIRSR